MRYSAPSHCPRKNQPKSAIAHVFPHASKSLFLHISAPCFPSLFFCLFLFKLVSAVLPLSNAVTLHTLQARSGRLPADHLEMGEEEGGVIYGTLCGGGGGWLSLSHVSFTPQTHVSYLGSSGILMLYMSIIHVSYSSLPATAEALCFRVVCPEEQLEGTSLNLAQMFT